jgi:hypothetical protein
MQRRAFAILISVILAFLCAGEVRADDIIWRSVRTRHFIVYYAGDDRATAVRAGQLAEKWDAILTKKLKFHPSGFTPINLYPNRHSFSLATGVRENDSIVGMAHNRMVSISVDASGVFTDIERIIPHELVHVFVSRRLRARAIDLPLWMHEGLAKYLASDWSGQDAELLAEVATEGRFYPLSEISSSFPDDPEKRSIAYVQSYAVVKYMADKYTDDCIPDLLTEMADGRPFDKAMRYSIGSEPDEFEQAWRAYVIEKYNFGRWTKFAYALIFPMMAILAIFAFRARRKALARKAEEFEEESASDPDEFEDLG